MATLRKILVWLLVLITICFLILYVVIRNSGKPVVERKISALFNRNAEIGDLRFIFPFGLRIDELNIEQAIKAQEARVQLGLLTLFSKEIVISSLYISEGSISLQRKTGSPIHWGEISQSSESGGVDKSKKEKEEEAEEESPDKPKQSSPKRDFGIIIDRLEIVNTNINFSDHSNDKGRDITLENITLKAQAISYPLKPYKTRYFFKAFIVNEDMPFSGSRVEGDGWINFHDRDMDGDLKIIEPSGMVGLSADLKAKKNDLTVKGKINMKSLVSAGKKAETESESFSLDDLLLGALQSTGIEIKADFAIKTKLDDFQFSSIAFSGNLGFDGSGKSSGAIQADLKNMGRKFYEENIKNPEE